MDPIEGQQTTDQPVDNGTQVTPSDVSQQQEPTGINPAWKPLYEKLPTQLHPIVEPTLREWDQNYSKVQEQFKPYQRFAEQGIQAEAIESAMQVAQLLNNNPGYVLQQIINRAGDLGLNLTDYGIGVQTPSQGQQSSDGSVDFSQVPDFSDNGGQQFDVMQHPAVLALQQQVEELRNLTVGQYQAQQQAEQQAKEDAALDQALQSLSSKHGELPQEHLRTVFALASSGTPLEDAYSYVASNLNRPAAPAPSVMSPGGGLPSSAVDVASLGDKDRRSLAINWLKQAREG